MSQLTSVTFTEEDSFEVIKNDIMLNVRWICFVTIILGSQFSYGQELLDYQIDEVTGDSIKLTSWEGLNEAAVKSKSYFRISSYNGELYLDLKLIVGGSEGVFSINEGAALTFTMKNGDPVVLKSIEHVTTCKGCGAISESGNPVHGVQVSYAIPPEAYVSLVSGTVTKFRVSTSGGFTEALIKPKGEKKLKNALELMR